MLVPGRRGGVQGRGGGVVGRKRRVVEEVDEDVRKMGDGGGDFLVDFDFGGNFSFSHSFALSFSFCLPIATLRSSVGDTGIANGESYKKNQSQPQIYREIKMK